MPGTSAGSSIQNPAVGYATVCILWLLSLLRCPKRDGAHDLRRRRGARLGGGVCLRCSRRAEGSTVAYFDGVDGRLVVLNAKARRASQGVYAWSARRFLHGRLPILAISLQSLPLVAAAAAMAGPSAVRRTEVCRCGRS